jgi:hypothetical protein
MKGGVMIVRFSQTRNGPEEYGGISVGEQCEITREQSFTVKYNLNSHFFYISIARQA